MAFSAILPDSSSTTHAPCTLRADQRALPWHTFCLALPDWQHALMMASRGQALRLVVRCRLQLHLLALTVDPMAGSHGRSQEGDSSA